MPDDMLVVTPACEGGGPTSFDTDPANLSLTYALSIIFAAVFVIVGVGLLVCGRRYYVHKRGGRDKGVRAVVEVVEVVGVEETKTVARPGSEISGSIPWP